MSKAPAALARIGQLALLVAIASCASNETTEGSGGAGNTAAGTSGHAGSGTGGTGTAGRGGGAMTAGSAGTAGSTTTAGSGGQGVAGGAGGVSGTGGSAATSGGSSGRAGNSGASGMSGAAGRAGSGGSAGTAGSSAGGGGGGDASGGSAGESGVSGGGFGGKATLGKFVGNITTRAQVRSDFIDYWNQITPENEGKWGSIERQRDTMEWAGMDRVRDYAREHNIPYKGHALVWGSQQPNWIGNLSASEQREEVEEWIAEFCERYPDVALIDVVNEPPPHTTPAYLNALGGAGQSGYDWIVQAFVWARQYCPYAVLILNDYNNIEYQADNDRTIDIVNRIKRAGAPIDAVGVQAHAAFERSTSSVEAFINRIADMTDLPVHVTEYDINVADDARQREIMQSQFTMFWNNENVAAITLWGYISGNTWLPNTGLMSSSGQPRPAFTWLMDFLESQRAGGGP